MEFDIESLLKIHQDMPRQGGGRDEYTQKAYEMIPKINQPKILDIGCGPGMQTIKLAKISGGQVTGIDIFEQFLDQLRESIKKENLQSSVKAVNMSMLEIKYPEESFDIIWAEGSIFIIGFEEGLKQWKKYIKPNGFLAVHEMAWLQDNPPEEIYSFWQRVYPQITTIPNNLEVIKNAGYKVLGHFPLPEDAWWEFYYDPLQKRLDKLRVEYKDDPKLIERMDEDQLEIDLYRKYSSWYGSVFYVMQKQ